MKENLSPTLNKRASRVLSLSRARALGLFLAKLGEGLLYLVFTLILSVWNFWTNRFSLVYIRRVKREGSPSKRLYRIAIAKTLAEAREAENWAPIVFSFRTYNEEIAENWLRVLRNQYAGRSQGGDVFRFEDKDLVKIEMTLRPYKLRLLTIFLYWGFRSLEELKRLLLSHVSERSLEIWESKREKIPLPGTKSRKM